MEVSDVDREAANSVLYCAVPDSFSTEGQFKLDLDKVAEAFAKHRATQAAELDALRSKLRNVVSHATGGNWSDHADASLNDICVEISRFRNVLYQDGKDKGREECQPELDALRGEVERFRGALEAIDKAVLDGNVCDDVAWFSGIETLHDFISSVLLPEPPAAIGDLYGYTRPTAEATIAQLRDRVAGLEEMLGRWVTWSCGQQGPSPFNETRALLTQNEVG